MGQDTTIQWATHTFNPWIGCSRVSTGCKFCYAEELMDHRYGRAKWGDNGTRSVTSDSNWKHPIAWDKAARKSGERHRVFCASLGDVFEDRPELLEPRARLFRLICGTPNLDWLLLTKRPENALRLMVQGGLYACENPDMPCPQPNIWVGTSVEDQQRADERIPHLLEIPAVVRFLSVEPLLGPIDFRKVPGFNRIGLDLSNWWVIVGGESGRSARPCDLDWIRSIRDQCATAGVPCFIKQLGAKPFFLDDDGAGVGPVCCSCRLKDSHGGDEAEWPADLRDCRHFPAIPTPATTA